MQMKNKIRKLNDLVFSICCWIAVVIVGATIASIIWNLIKNGGGALKPSLFFHITNSPEMHGGLANAIIGSLIITTIAMIIAIPIGFVIALYLAEFSKGKKISQWVRFINDVLLSAPSIIIGLFCYTILVAPMHHFSAISGSIALAIIALPIIIRTSEDMLSIAPQSLREAASALGAPYWRVIFSILLRAVYRGIITGILLALARILGETAPLLFTSLNNQFWNTSLNKPMASLPIVIYRYAMSPYPQWQHIAWGGALLITIGVCLLSIASRLFHKEDN